jgi:hypothetical protein
MGDYRLARALAALLALLVTLTAAPLPARADLRGGEAAVCTRPRTVRVRTYQRRNGTVVREHYRTRPTRVRRR